MAEVEHVELSHDQWHECPECDGFGYDLVLALCDRCYGRGGWYTPPSASIDAVSTVNLSEGFSSGSAVLPGQSLMYETPEGSDPPHAPDCRCDQCIPF